MQDAIVSHLVDPDYPPALLQTKVDLNVAFISLRVGGSISIQGGHATDWGVIAGSRVGALFCAWLNLCAETPPLTTADVLQSQRTNERVFHSQRSTAPSSILLDRRLSLSRSRSGSLEPGTPLCNPTPFATLIMSSSHFSLCQYPFLLSLGIKILLLTWDGRRQMVRCSRSCGAGASLTVLGTGGESSTLH